MDKYTYIVNRIANSMKTADDAVQQAPKEQKKNQEPGMSVVSPENESGQETNFDTADVKPSKGMTVVDDKGKEITPEAPKEAPATKITLENEEPNPSSPPLPKLDENGMAITDSAVTPEEDEDVSDESNESIDESTTQKTDESENKENESVDINEESSPGINESMGQLKDDLQKSEEQNEEEMAQDSRFSDGEVATEFDPEMKEKYVNAQLFDSRIEQMNKFVHNFDDIEGRMNNVTFKAVAANLDWSNLDDVKAFEEHCNSSGVDGSSEVLAFIYHNYNDNPESFDRIMKKMD